MKLKRVALGISFADIYQNLLCVRRKIKQDEA